MTKLLELTLPTAAENLAIDEALLELVDQADDANAPNALDILRLWEPTHPFVVIGRASKVAEEIDLAYCSQNEIAVHRRCSGGASVVALPGCLMYAIVLNLHHHPELRMIERAHTYVLDRIQRGLRQAGLVTAMDGTSDLTIECDSGVKRKVSGNSLRCKRNAFLYHGTILCDADLELISRCLRTAPRQPDYRDGREHADFIANLNVPTSRIWSELIECWDVDDRLDPWPIDETRRLVADRYSSDAWNLRH